MKQIKRKVGQVLQVHELKQELSPAVNFNLKATIFVSKLNSQ